MRFTLTPQRLGELQKELSELKRWVRELEELDLAEYDVILDPAPREATDGG